MCYIIFEFMSTYGVLGLINHWIIISANLQLSAESVTMGL